MLFWKHPYDITRVLIIICNSLSLLFPHHFRRAATAMTLPHTLVPMTLNATLYVLSIGCDIICTIHPYVYEIEL